MSYARLFASASDGATIRPPFRCDFGRHISIGAGSFMNFNGVILDVIFVTIGVNTQIGPAVQIYTADHPRDPVVRRSGAEFARPVVLGNRRCCTGFVKNIAEPTGLKGEF